MKASIVVLMMTFSLVSIAGSGQIVEGLMTSNPSLKRHGVLQHYSNIEETIKNPQRLSRTRDYPTQIVRIEGDILDSTRHCNEILAEISAFFTKKITSDKFIYNTLVFCGYDPETEYAVRYTINSYFDPINDAAIDYLQTYLSEHNGQPLLGTLFEVEDASGVAVSLNIDAGKKANQNDTILTRYKHDNVSHFFSSNYEMTKEMIMDIRASFFSHDPDVVLPFMQKWFFTSADKIYYYVLKSSNYVELQPERLFIMSKAPKVYTSPLKMYFAHHCSKYKNKRCL